MKVILNLIEATLIKKTDSAMFTFLLKTFLPFNNSR